METGPPNPHAESVRRLARAKLRTAVVPGLVTVAAATVVAGRLAGAAGAAGAVVGGAVAVAASLLTIGLMRWSAPLPVILVMAVAMGGYLVKVVGLLAVMMLLGGAEGLDVMSVALSFLATVLVWTAAEVVAFRRTPVPVVMVGGE